MRDEWDDLEGNHRPCPGGCGELDDECACPARRLPSQGGTR